MRTLKNKIEIENSNDQGGTYIMELINSLTIFNKALIEKNKAFTNRSCIDLSTYADYGNALDAYAEALIILNKYI